MQLAATLDSGTWVLTATTQLARHLQQRHAAEQASAGRAAWESAPILPWSAWLRRCWDELQVLTPPATLLAGASPEDILLSDLQSEALWQALVAEDKQGGEVLNLHGAAAAAEEAWRLLQGWRVPFPEWEAALRQQPQPEGLRFQAWSQAYQRRCDREGWLDGARLPGRVTRALEQGWLPVPPGVLLAGFDDISPAQQQVLDALQRRGCPVRQAPRPWLRGAAPATVGWAEFANAPEEMEAAARWARSLLEQDPRARLALVVPDLRMRLPALRHWLREVLAPHTWAPGAAQEALPFHFSLGEPFHLVSLVDSALLLLRGCLAPLTLPEVHRLLHSPYLGEAQAEQGARSQVELRLRRWGGEEWSLASLARAAAGEDAGGGKQGGAPRLAQRLTRAQHTLRQADSSQPLAGWARLFATTLREAGWPAQGGGRPLDSTEFQVTQKWQELLDALASLGQVLPSQSGRQAWSHLRRLAQGTDFQPQAGAAPLQVLGLLEAGGLEFDGLWVLGLDDQAWPRPARPNPFLPGSLQRAYGLPRSSAAHELAYARAVTARLASAAHQVVLSAPRAQGDEPRRASPLLREWPQLPPQQFPRSALERPLLTLARAALEPLADSQAPPLAAGGSSPGGTALLKNMAACPFRAFALHRLHAQAVESPEPGPSPAERGQILHAVLEGLWQHLRTAEALRQLAPLALAALVRQQVEQALAGFQARHPQRLSPALAALEAQRLGELAAGLLELERGRPAFAVQEQERTLHLRLGALELEARVDRLDQLPDGRWLLLDYKTGQNIGVRQWLSDRPDEPQLPLYALALERPLAGLAFVQVRKGQTRFVGWAEPPEMLPGTTPVGAVRGAAGPEFQDLARALRSWRAVLEALAARYVSGQAAVQPKRFPETCAYCPLPALCRVREARGALAEPAPEGADA